MAKSEAWPGFGQRVRQRLRELGYVRPDGGEDISTFTVKKGYVVTLFYKYLSNTTPSRENLLRLANDLDVRPSWLLFGDAPQVDAARLKRKAPTKYRGRKGRGVFLRQLHGHTVARAFIQSVRNPDRGVRILVAQRPA